MGRFAHVHQYYKLVQAVHRQSELHKERAQHDNQDGKIFEQKKILEQMLVDRAGTLVVEEEGSIVCAR